MTENPMHLTSISPDLILAGLGTLPRQEICSLIAILEKLDGWFLAKGAVQAIGDKIGLNFAKTAAEVDLRAKALEASALADGILRHRLWVRIAEELAVPEIPPLSPLSARRAAAAVAVRASERLSPSVVARRKKLHAKASEGALAEVLGARAAEAWKAATALVRRDDPLPFPELVHEELLNLISDEDLMAKVMDGADPEMAEKLSIAQANAQKALAAGGGWIAFAALVANSGFAPYMIAAKLSAWVPMVSGPTLVSLLATLVNPATVLVGIGGLAWLGMGNASSVLRSQVAARLCLVLAVSGLKSRESGLAGFLDDMRELDGAGSADLAYLTVQQRRKLRDRLAALNGRLSGRIPASAGAPPAPWDQSHLAGDIRDAAAVAALSAGEMLWHTVAIDPNVIAAADFSRAADLGDPISFALHAHDFAMTGADYALRGYVAERLVMGKLISEGHDVLLAPFSNTPGLDLIVDGLPVQVKCGENLSLLTEHFEKYPDIPVIANGELVELAQNEDWSELVTTVSGFDISSIEQGISEALGHAASLLDPDILQFALSIGVLGGGIEVARGKIPLGDLPAWLLLDGASRGMLSFLGGSVGGWLGLVAIGPAGVVILGPVAACAALVGNGAIKGEVEKRLSGAWRKELLDEGAELHAALVNAIERRITRLAGRLERLRPGHDSAGIIRWLHARAQDDLILALEDLSDLGRAPDTERACLELMFKTSTLAPADARVLRAVKALEEKFANKPGLHEVLLGKPLDRTRGVWRDRFLPALKDFSPRK